MDHSPFSSHSVIGMIPARFASTRFPSKLLHSILGKPLIQHTLENAIESGLFDLLCLATDDERIAEVGEKLGVRVCMTSEDCVSGTDRIAQAVQTFSPLPPEDAVIVNIQGDEPCIHHRTLRSVIEVLQNDPQSVMSTAAAPLASEGDFLDPSIVKCVRDRSGHALYFSRAPIPYSRNPGQVPLQHMGIYAYRLHFLNHYGELAPTPLQKAEDLEQLKVLEHGFRIQVAVVEEPSIGVDEPSDIPKVEQHLCKQNFSSSQEGSSPL